ncbi:MAG: galactose mutarotase [Bacteroidota bacterium]|nr:galactose mutarotase [Bacteroidota bacterium]
MSYVLSNNRGMSITVLNYGATLARIEVPDRQGNAADVLLGHEKLKNFIGGRFYLGGTIGRYANRIKAGRFKLDGKEYQVTVNSKGNMLHGGTVGFDKKFWEASIDEAKNAVEFSLISPDGEEGFPGTMEIKAAYELSDDNEVRIRYRATTDKTTVVNLTNHAYFNLTGNPAGSILDHILMINAEKFTPTDGASIPTGEIENVAGTPMDFTTPAKIGARIDDDDIQLRQSKGYDHNYVLNDFNGSVRTAATVYDPSCGRLMEVLTDQPGVQFYSGNNLDGAMQGKKGIYYQPRAGLCLECQHFPNSPNEKKFPSAVLEPASVYTQNTVYKFSVK